MPIYLNLLNLKLNLIIYQIRFFKKQINFSLIFLLLSNFLIWRAKHLYFDGRIILRLNWLIILLRNVRSVAATAWAWISLSELSLYEWFEQWICKSQYWLLLRTTEWSRIVIIIWKQITIFHLVVSFFQFLIAYLGFQSFQILPLFVHELIKFSDLIF